MTINKRVLTIMFANLLTIATLAGCGKTETISADDMIAETETVAETVTGETTPDVAEEVHEHIYAETITMPATCFETGEKSFACDCGDTYTETIPAAGHDFSDYVSNEDATYEADGTETATCSTCGETDTRVAEGSMLTYSFEDMDATKYAKSTVNVRSIPIADGEKLGSLSTNDEVKVTGKCNETSWYRIAYADGIAYVSNDYLVDEKVEVTQAPEPEQENNQTASGGLGIITKSGYSYVSTTVSSYDEAVAAFKAVGIEPWVTHEENGTRWCYAIICHVFGPTNKGNHEADFDKYVFYNFNGYDWGNRLGTKDGRVYVDDVNGGSWSIQECIARN